MKPLVESIVKCLSGYDGERVQDLLGQGLNLDKRIFDNSKVSDHHALIPTNVISRLGQTELTEQERNVAQLVIDRFLGALDLPFLYNEMRYEFQVEGEKFRLTTRMPVQLGWHLYRKEREEYPTFGYNEGDSFLAENVTVREGKTKPLKHFTESSLLAVMENIDCLIEDKTLKVFVKDRGLGTPATRAAIIKELIAAGYIERKKKLLLSTDYGKAFAEFLPKNVKSAELTAHWEQMLSDIENGKESTDTLLHEIKQNVSDIIAFEKQCKQRTPVTRKVIVGTCPRCGKPVSQNSRGFSCSGGRDNCGFFIWGQDKRIVAEATRWLRSGSC